MAESQIDGIGKQLREMNEVVGMKWKESLQVKE